MSVHFTTLNVLTSLNVGKVFSSRRAFKAGAKGMPEGREQKKRSGTVRQTDGARGGGGGEGAGLNVAVDSCPPPFQMDDLILPAAGILSTGTAAHDGPKLALTPRHF